MDAPSNPLLVQAMVALREASSEEMEARLRAFLNALTRATLISGTEDDPFTVEVDDQDYLAVFSDLIELHFFEPGARWARLEGPAAIKAVAGGEFDGLVINAGPRQIELSREDIEDFFELDVG